MLTYDAKIDYYAILNLSSEATTQEIKKAYYHLALKHHPDKHGDPEQFKILAAAYEILMDEETKAQYDIDSLTHRLVQTRSSSSQEKQDSQKDEQGSMIFNTTRHTHLSASTSIVQRNNTNDIASAGIKAADMGNTELFNLAENHEFVALALVKNIAQLKRFSEYDLMRLALKHTSFAYQILACSETRVFLYSSFFLSVDVVKLLKNDYNVLLLIASSDELTKNLLYRYGHPMVSGTCLHEIYDRHLKDRGSCQAFDLLLESNEQLKRLYDNYQIIQSGNGQYSLSQLELLDIFELHQLALNDQNVATQVVNSQCIHKFQFLYVQRYLIDILLAYPKLLERFFKSERPFYFDHNEITYGCEKSHDFLLYILNSPEETNRLNGYDIETIIEKDINNQEHIYRNEKLKSKHVHYKAFVARLTDHTTIYSPKMEDIAEIDVSILSNTLYHVSKTYDHSLLATNAALLMDFYHWNDAFWINYISDISLEFFCAIYDKKSLRSGCYKNSDRHSNRYFKAFEILCQDPDAQFSDEQIYDLQQKWLPIEKRKVTEIFNTNPDLMQRWFKGYRIKKLHQSVIVYDYEEQQSLSKESEAIIKIRSTVSSLQQYLHFNNIIVSEGNHEFISWLVEQDSCLLNIASMQSIDNNLLPGIFWFLAITDRPQLLNEHLPLDLINQQIEMDIDKLKKGVSIDMSWLIIRQVNINNQTIYHLLPAPVQENLWFNLLLTNFDVRDKHLWSKLLGDNNFINHLMNNITLVEFLKSNENIALLREFTSLQEYFIANHTLEIQDQLFEIVNSCCKQNQFGDALTLFSLMHQSRLESNLDNPLPDYSEHQSESANKLFYKSAALTGLAGMLIATDLDIASGSSSIMFSSAMATCALLMVLGTYKLYENQEPVDKVVTISYREALSRKNIAMFFKSKPLGAVDKPRSNTSPSPWA